MNTLELNTKKNNIVGAYFAEKGNSDRQLIWNINSGIAVADIKYFSLETDFDKLEKDYSNGICFECSSKDTEKHINNSYFWGCNTCGYGFWDEYLQLNIRKEFYKINNLIDRLEKLKRIESKVRLDREFKVKEYYRILNARKENNAKQLTLF